MAKLTLFVQNIVLPLPSAQNLNEFRLGKAHLIQAEFDRFNRIGRRYEIVLTLVLFSNADSSTGFTLPDGSTRSPGAAWMTLAKWQRLTEDEKESFAPVCPDFVLELKSKTDRLADLQEKMESRIANSAPLGWLVVLEEETVYIYQPRQAVRQHSAFSTSLSGDPVLPGFQLDFSKLSLPKGALFVTEHSLPDFEHLMSIQCAFKGPLVVWHFY